MISYKSIQPELQEFVRRNEHLLRLFKGNSFFVSGAGGLIGSYLVWLLMEANKMLGLGVEVAAVDRDEVLLKRFFGEGEDYVKCHRLDVCSGVLPEGRYDYIIHAASNTSPLDYASKPIDTIWTNVCGAKRLLDLAVKTKSKRFLFCSSVEVYGRNNGDVDSFSEEYSGFVDCNTVRAGYPSSKRCVEALCNAYAAEYGDFDFVIARIGRIYGPTVVPDDAKAPSQFIANAASGERVILKSKGTQLYSWGYVGDCASALLTLLKKGEKGGAYNVADPNSRSKLIDFATIAAKSAGVGVETVEQTEAESSAYSKITKATMDTSKLESLGWTAAFSLEDGISRTVRYLRGK